MKPHWHELSPEWQAAEAARGAQASEFKPPPWCLYREAVGGLPMGCFSLMLGHVHCIKDCYNCDENGAAILKDCNCYTDMNEARAEEEFHIQRKKPR